MTHITIASPQKDPRAGLPGQVVLVLQGGGALGSYQAGVYQALHEAGIEPDWIIGTSIGAINAALIAGNEPQYRVDKLREFWRRMASNPTWGFPGAWPGLQDMASAQDRTRAAGRIGSMAPVTSTAHLACR